VSVQAQATLAAGGEVWVADETALREFPPLRAGWSKRGEPAQVIISGRNKRRTILGALQVSTGEMVHTVRERCRTDDVLAAVEALGAVRPDVPKLLIWDNAPPHQPHRVRDAAAAASISVAFLPFRSPELMPLEDLWRGLKATVAANRCYPSLEELTQRAVTWLDGMSGAERLRRCGFEASKFDWLPTYTDSR
jgi:transposase